MVDDAREHMRLAVAIACLGIMAGELPCLEVCKHASPEGRDLPDTAKANLERRMEASLRMTKSY